MYAFLGKISFHRSSMFRAVSLVSRSTIKNGIPSSIIFRNMSKEKASKAVKPGANIVVENAPHRVKKITQGKRGKGGGYVRALVKHLVTGNTFEKTFTSDETVEIADMEKEVHQYTWNDGENFSFLNTTSYEEVQLPKEDVENYQFLLEGQEVKLVKYNGKVIGVELPKMGEFQVMKIDAQKISSGFQAAILDSGAEVMVPIFINEGMKIKVNIEDAEYVERVN